MSNTFFMKSQGNGCAVFEIEKDKAIISATLGFSSMMYKSEMSIEKGREEWKKLQARGFVQISEKEAVKLGFSHNYVWNFYN